MNLTALLGAPLQRIPPAQGPLVARLAGRAWWVVRYRDGDEIAEWSGTDWSLLPRKSLLEVRLYCPDGQVAVLGNSEDASDRLFQFKTATATVGADRGTSRTTEQQIIGRLDGTDGQCTAFAWDYRQRRLVGPVADHYWMLQLGGIATRGGTMLADVLGVSPD